MSAQPPMPPNEPPASGSSHRPQFAAANPPSGAAMPAPSPTQRLATAAAPAPKSLLVGLWTLVALALTQGVLAGLFLNTAPGARLGHLILGSLLPYVSFALLVIAIVHHANRRIRTPLAVAVYAVPVLLWAQAILGHVNMPATIAIHIPFGIAMTVYPAVLAVVAARPTSPLSRPDPRQGSAFSAGSVS